MRIVEESSICIVFTTKVIFSIRNMLVYTIVNKFLLLKLPNLKVYFNFVHNFESCIYYHVGGNRSDILHKIKNHD